MASITRLSVLVFELSNAINSFIKTINAPEPSKMLYQASAVNRLAILGFSAAETFMSLSGSKSEALSRLKGFELIPKMLNLPIQLTLELNDSRGEITARTVVRILEQGVVAPLAGIVGTAAEQISYYEQHFLEMTPEELKNAKRPIFEFDQNLGGPVIIGYAPVDAEECQKRLNVADRVAQTSLHIRVLGEVGFSESVTFDALIPFYQYLAQFLSAPAIAPRQPVQQRAIVPAQQQRAPNILNLNFLAFDEIPIPLYEDVVFRRFICPISNCPIRNPVYDPNGRTLYERGAIQQWIAVRPISPVTRLPLTVAQLVEAPAVRALIDDRLQFHQDRMVQVLQQGLELPVIEIVHRPVLDRHQ